ncbi:MAG: thiosulfate oxidation carrier protein SoxY [Pseudomonadota bacterium]
MKRRSFLKGTLAIAAGFGLLRPIESLAAAEPVDAFAARSETDVLTALFENTRSTPSGAVKIKAPILAMPGKAIAFKVLCDLDGVEMIAIVTANNRHPLNTYVSLFDADGYYNTRLRLEQTSMVTAYVKTGGELYSASTYIKVSRGGYGMYF